MYIHTHIVCIHIYIYIHTYIHTYIPYIYIYIYTHTPIRTSRLEVRRQPGEPRPRGDLYQIYYMALYYIN